MNNNQGEMDALPPFIERVDQQLTPFSEASLLRSFESLIVKDQQNHYIISLYYYY